MVNWQQIGKCLSLQYQRFFKENDACDIAKAVWKQTHGGSHKKIKAVIEFFRDIFNKIPNGWAECACGQPKSEYPVMALVDRTYELLQAKGGLSEADRQLHQGWKEKHEKEKRAAHERRNNANNQNTQEEQDFAEAVRRSLEQDAEYPNYFQQDDLGNNNNFNGLDQEGKDFAEAVRRSLEQDAEYPNYFQQDDLRNNNNFNGLDQEGNDFEEAIRRSLAKNSRKNDNGGYDVAKINSIADSVIASNSNSDEEFRRAQIESLQLEERKKQEELEEVLRLVRQQEEGRPSEGNNNSTISPEESLEEEVPLERRQRKSAIEIYSSDEELQRGINPSFQEVQTGGQAQKEKPVVLVPETQGQASEVEGTAEEEEASVVRSTSEVEGQENQGQDVLEARFVVVPASQEESEAINGTSEEESSVVSSTSGKQQPSQVLASPENRIVVPTSQRQGSEIENSEEESVDVPAISELEEQLMHEDVALPESEDQDHVINSPRASVTDRSEIESEGEYSDANNTIVIENNSEIENDNNNGERHHKSRHLQRTLRNGKQFVSRVERSSKYLDHSSSGSTEDLSSNESEGSSAE